MNAAQWRLQHRAVLLVMSAGERGGDGNVWLVVQASNREIRNIYGRE